MRDLFNNHTIVTIERRIDLGCNGNLSSRNSTIFDDGTRLLTFYFFIVTWSWGRGEGNQY